MINKPNALMGYFAQSQSTSHPHADGGAMTMGTVHHAVGSPADSFLKPASDEVQAHRRAERQAVRGKKTGQLQTSDQAGDQRAGTDTAKRTPAKRREQKSARKTHDQIMRLSQKQSLVSFPGVTHTAQRDEILRPSTTFAFDARPGANRMANRASFAVHKSCIEYDANQTPSNSKKMPADMVADVVKFEPVNDIEKAGSPIRHREPPRSIAQLSTSSRLEEKALPGEAHVALAAGPRANPPVAFSRFIERIRHMIPDPFCRTTLETLIQNEGKMIRYEDFGQAYANHEVVTRYRSGEFPKSDRDATLSDMLCGRDSIQGIVVSLKTHFRANNWPWEFIEAQEGLIYIADDDERAAMKNALRAGSLMTPEGKRFTPADLRKIVPEIRHERFWDAVLDMLSGSHLSMMDLRTQTELAGDTIEEALFQVNLAAQQHLGIKPLFFRGYYGYQTTQLTAYPLADSELFPGIEPTTQTQRS